MKTKRQEEIQKYQKNWRLQNREKLREYNARYYIENSVRIRERSTKYYTENKGAVSLVLRDYRERTKDSRSRFQKQYRMKTVVARAVYSREYKNKRRQHDITFKLTENLRSRLYKITRGQVKTGSAVSDLGCSVAILKTHLESLFTPGMSWDNLHLLHIDHIRPLASFDLSDPEQLKQACHYTNLQPLWAKDNMSKGARVDNKPLTLRA